MTLRINGSTSGYVELDAPATGDNSTAVLPTGGGTLGRTVLETAKTATGTAVDFTAIPAWAKKITVTFNGVSLNSAVDIVIQIGTNGTPQATSYTSAATILGNATVTGSLTTGFEVTQSMAATDSASGAVTLCNVSGNVWAQSGLLTRTQGGLTASAGSVSLSGALDIVRITGGTFDAGTINLLLEG